MINLQLEWIKIIQSVHSPLLDTLFQYLTMMGEESFFLVIMAFLIWAVDKKRGMRIGFMLLSGALVNTILKVVVNSKRPIGESGIRSIRVETANGASFPSGHTQNTATFWTGMVLSFGKPWIVVLGVILTITVAFSRLYLGVHWPVDVAGGMLIGYGWAYAVNCAMDWIERYDKRAWLLGAAVLLLTVGMIFNNDIYVKATATMVGFVAGYIFEHKYVGYVCRGSWWSRFTGFAICLAILLGLKMGLKVVFPKLLIFDAIRYGILGFWVTFGAPALLKNKKSTR